MHPMSGPASRRPGRRQGVVDAGRRAARLRGLRRRARAHRAADARPGRSCTRGSGRRRSATWPGTTGWSRSTGGGAAARAGRRGRRRTPTTSTPRTSSRCWTRPAPTPPCWSSLSCGASRGRCTSRPRTPSASSGSWRSRRPAACDVRDAGARTQVPWDEPLDDHHGWAKYNKHYWLGGGYDDFVGVLLRARCSPSRTPRSRSRTASAGRTRSRRRRWPTRPPAGSGATGRSASRSSRCAAKVRCPVLVVHGTDDRIRPQAIGEQLAELTGGDLVLLEGVGHGPSAATR